MLKEVEINIIENIISQLKARTNIELLDPELDNEFISYIRKSLLMDSYHDLYTHTLVKMLDSEYDTKFMIAEVTYPTQTGKYSHISIETQIIGFKRLDFNYGHIFIRPETFEDKLSEIFIKSEIDFKEFPKFSSKYYFLSDNEPLAHAFATSSRLQLIEKQREILIEIKEDRLITKFSRKLTTEDCENMIEFIERI
jgi:hypothetical protein